MSDHFAAGRRSISVVVPTHNGGPMLLDCLERLGPVALEGELILVDNASTDGSVATAAMRLPQARVVRNEVNVGYALACNQGAAAATCDFLLFLNNDAFIDADNVDRLATAATIDTEGAIWQPVNLRPDRTVEFAGDYFTSWGFFLHAEERPDGLEPVSVFSTKAACLLVRRKVFEALGGFNANYFAYFEEADLCWRARLAGWEVRVVAAAEVEHVSGSTTRRVLRPEQVRYLSFRNRFRTILANASPRSLARMIPLHLIGCLGFAAMFLLTGRARSTRAILAALLWPIRNPRAVLSQRRAAQSVRRLRDERVLRSDLTATVGPAIVLRHFRQQIYRWESTRDQHVGAQSTVDSPSIH